MTREELILKWLDNDLDAQEFEAFKALEDYDALTKLSDSVQQFKAPDYQNSEELQSVLSKINTVQQKTNWSKHLIKIAAILAISFSVYFYTTTLDTTITTLAAQKTNIELPDASQVSLNALSSLTFNKKDWDDERDISLNGEAYFNVAKGERFTVNTPSGIVTVLGTQFNVKQRDNLFEVVCYEGAVKVAYQSEIKILKPGDNFLILNGKYIAKEKEIATIPSWINNESYFKSMPFAHVLREFERQYNITITSHNIDLKQRFTGSFVHNDRTLALKSITLPLHLKFSIKDDSIVLTRE